MPMQTIKPVEPFKQMYGCRFSFEVNWGASAMQMLHRLGRVLHSWRQARTMFGDDMDACHRQLQISIEADDKEIELLNSVGLLDRRRLLGISGFFIDADLSAMETFELRSEEDGGDAEALARLLSLVMWKHTQETGSKVVFSFATVFDRDNDCQPGGGLVLVTPTGYRVQTMDDLAARLSGTDFWPHTFDEAGLVLLPTDSYLLPEEMRLANRLPRSVGEVPAAGPSSSAGPAL